jgi:hypothetical protein
MAKTIATPYEHLEPTPCSNGRELPPKNRWIWTVAVRGPVLDLMG